MFSGWKQLQINLRGVTDWVLGEFLPHTFCQSVRFSNNPKKTLSNRKFATNLHLELKMSHQTVCANKKRDDGSTVTHFAAGITLDWQRQRRRPPVESSDLLKGNYCWHRNLTHPPLPPCSPSLTSKSTNASLLLTIPRRCVELLKRYHSQESLAINKL